MMPASEAQNRVAVTDENDRLAVRPDQLASEALALLNASKITGLIVVDADRPLGSVHFHDLLRAGVA